MKLSTHLTLNAEESMRFVSAVQESKMTLLVKYITVQCACTTVEENRMSYAKSRKAEGLHVL